MPPASADARGDVSRVSTTASGAQAAGKSHNPAASKDGRYIAFASTARLADADANTALDVYRKDTFTGVVDLVSVNVLGNGAGDGPSGTGDIAISSDGRYVAFESAAGNLVLGDANSAVDVFVRDLQTASTQRANVNNDGTPATTNNGASFASVSGNGQRIAFFSRDSLRTSSGAAPGPGVYVRDLGNGILPAVTLFAGNTTAGEQGVEAQVAISNDGNVVAYLESAPGRIRRRDLRTNASSIVRDGGTPAGLVGPDALSGDGSLAVFWAERDGRRDVFAAGSTTTTVVSVLHDGTPTTTPTGTVGAVSGDGRYVVFTTAAGAMVKDRLSGLLTPIAPLADDVTITVDGSKPIFSSTAADLVPNDTNEAADVFAYARDQVATPFNVSLVALDPVTPPGAFATPARKLPTSAVPLPALDLVQDTSIDSIDMVAAPLRSVPLRSVPLRSVPLRSVPLRSVLLSEVRLLGTTWDAVLASLSPNPFVGRPLQSITLDEVLAADPPALRALTLAQIDLSSTPLRSVSLASLALGATPLRSVPLPDGQDWCGLLHSLGFACDELGLTEDSPLLALDLVGVPLRSVPLRSVPLRSVDLSAAPLRSVPLRSVHLDGLPLGGLIAPAAVADCEKVACGTATLADVARANAFRADATLGTLFDNVDRSALPGSLAELLLALIDPADYPWEQLNVLDIPVADYADAPREVRYEVSFSVAGDEPAPASVNVTLPPGFRFSPGSAAFSGTPIADPAADGTFVLGSVAAGSTGNTLTFRARPDLVLGAGRTSGAVVRVGDRTAAAAEQAAVRIVDDESEQAPVIGPDTVYTSHIGSPGDVDTFRIPVPAKGTRLAFRLGNQTETADVDLAVYNPAGAVPVRSVPLRSVPLRSVPMTDEGLDVQAAQVLSTDVQDDFVRNADLPLRAVSQNRGAVGELVSFVSDADPGDGRYYTVQVSGYNGSFSVKPYVLYARAAAPEVPPACPSPRTLPRAGEGVAGTAPALATLPAGLNTLFLVAQQRMGDTYGAAAAAGAVDAMRTLSSRADLGVVGAVWPVESSPAVARTLAAWDADPCSVSRANDAFRAIADIVDLVRAARPTLRNIVIAGGDDLVPMARLRDDTKIANESAYVDDAVNGDGPQNGTPLTASLATSHILSDDPIGDTDPIPWLDHSLYVPDLAVGRLVESPADVVAQIEQFTLAGGVLDPGTALTTGYDFLSDGARAVADGLARPGERLINDTWTAADERAALDRDPGIASLNAHYDHKRSLPGLGNSTGDESDLFTTDDVRASARRVLFTMGCHAGLNVPDSYMTAAGGESDWAQTFARNGAAVYLANTGYGYGDTAAVAYSEELMRLFATRLDGSLTIGDAAVYAKQAYFGALGAYGPYDEKVVQQAAFFGLPMYRVAGPGTVPPPPPGRVTAPDASGIQSAPIAISPEFTKHASPAGGQYFSVNGEVQLMHYRPIEPRTSLDVTPADPSLTAHGVLLTELSSTDQPIVPAVSRPVVDLSANEPPPAAGDVAFPASIHTLTAFNTPAGPRQRAVFMPGQFFRDADWAGNGGVQRLFDRIGAEVKYSASSDYTPPFVTGVVSDLDTATGALTMRLTATDADSGVVRVLVLVKDESGLWRRVELTRATPASSEFVGVLTGVTGAKVEWFAQAMDGAGNVGDTSNKARYFGARTNNAPLPLALSPQQPTGSNGWFVDPVTFAIATKPDVAYTITVNGATKAYAGPEQLATDLVHRVDAAGTDGSSGTGIVPIDRTAPALSGAPDRAANAAGWYNAPVVVRFACADPVSDVKACGPGATVGEGVGQVVTGVAVDWAGNQTSTTVGPLDVDLTPPVVRIDGVVDGGVYTAGSEPVPACAASDALSGLAGACQLTVVKPSDGGGQYTATATAADRAGNVTTASASWFVQHRFGGFLDPINDTGAAITSQTSVFKAGSTIPVKFQVLDAAGNPISVDSPPAWLTPVRGPAIGPTPVNEAPSKLSPTSGMSYVFDARATRYQFNWQPPKDMAGYYWLIGARLDDGSTHAVYVGIK